MRHLFALLLLGLPATLVGASERSSPAREALDYVCGAKQLDCTHLPPPRVRYAEIADLIGAYGYYWYEHDDSVVWLDVQFEARPYDWPSMAVLVHEVTHYVDHHLVDAHIDSCTTEANAFAVMNLWLLEHGHGDAARWNWRVQYGC